MIFSIVLWVFILSLQLVVTGSENEDSRFGVIAVTNIFLLFYLVCQARAMW